MKLYRQEKVTQSKHHGTIYKTFDWTGNWDYVVFDPYGQFVDRFYKFEDAKDCLYSEVRD